MENKSIIPYYLSDDGTFPNNRLPLLVYPDAVSLARQSDPADDPPAIIEALFRANRWGSSWRNGVYSFHHYHSTAHEVLGVYGGEAVIRFGGEKGVTIQARVGDAILIPAGVAHKKLSSSGGFAVVGAYPTGQGWDMNYGNPGERLQADRNIAQTGLPALDPVLGEGGLLALWS